MAQNLSSTELPPDWDPEYQCMDSTQMWFCRDLWTDAAKDGLKGSKGGFGKVPVGHNRKVGHKKRDEVPAESNAEPASLHEDEKDEAAIKQAVEFAKRQNIKDDKEQDSGTDNDAMDESEENAAPEPINAQDQLPASAFLIPNAAFTPARILVNPRCVTTYGGVSHTQLALDLFGTKGHEDSSGKYALEDWMGPPDSFVCQEMRTTGGRTAPKSQRRVGWLLQNEVSSVASSSRNPVSIADLIHVSYVQVGI